MKGDDRMCTNIPIKEFHREFDDNYALLYDNKDDVESYHDAVLAFDEFAKEHSDFVGEYAKYRHDYISSDREAAAFMFALEKYIPLAIRKYKPQH